MDENQRERNELHKTLQGKGERPGGSLQITRRTFLHKSVGAGAAGVATYGWFPFIGRLDFLVGQAGGPPTAFKFAWISDNPLYPKDVNTRFVDKAVRAVKEVQAMKPAADFLIHGGDLAQLGDPHELDLGNDILKEVKIKKAFIPGEHDSYLHIGQKRSSLFGASNS